MNKKIKMLTAVVLLGSSLLTSIPVHATTVISQEKNSIKQDSINEIDNEDISRSGEALVIKGKNVALRKNPGLHTKVLERLDNPQKVIWVSTGTTPRVDGHEWIYVGYPSSKGMIYGYVSSKYLSF
ncbi:hypothetical protein DVW05_16405 [Clostridium botulinum]|uniref:hypothetical protein n=1 Tax=Clostridium sp. ZBS18 TaxID=2949967 RepID=UPI001D66592F|nr:hypothetical protein [Clostridium sp. ZBS18]MBN1056908.1 hypothetical protein [Clostridium botulinum]